MVLRVPEYLIRLFGKRSLTLGGCGRHTGGLTRLRARERDLRVRQIATDVGDTAGVQPANPAAYALPAVGGTPFPGDGSSKVGHLLPDTLPGTPKARATALYRDTDRGVASGHI